MSRTGTWVWNGARRWWVVGLTAAALATIGVAMGVLRLGRATQPAWPAEALEVAGTSPRLLLSGGWTVLEAHEITGADGEITFERGTRGATLTWRPGGTHARYLADRAADAQLRRRIRVLGEPASLFKYEGADHDFTVLWRRGSHSLEMRAVAVDVREFAHIAGALRAVSVDTWLSAMPKGLITPGRAAAVTGMLKDIPVPPDVDVGALKRRPALEDRYQLGIEVTRTAFCAWIDEWIAARRHNDAPAATTAEKALAGSHDWAILKEMERPGDWPEVLWSYADVAAGRRRPPRGTTPEGYVERGASDLGCAPTTEGAS